MVKHGGTKRKIPMEKIGKKESLATAFTKRSHGLYSKASQICLLSGAQIAVLATPPSSQSNASFYSFGHSSVDAVVSAFLSGNRPVPVREETREDDAGICLARKDLGLGSWWEEDSLARSENPQELTEAINSMSSLLAKFKELREGESFRNHNQRDLKSEPDQILIPRPDSPICRIPDDLPSDYNEITEEQSQILAICDTEEKNNSKDMALNQEMDIDQFIDFETAFDSAAFDAWLLESGQMLADDVSTNPNFIYDLDQDNRRFSDLFNTIAAV